MPRLLGYNWDRLDSAGARAYDADTLAREIDSVVWPGSGVVPLTLEGIETFDVRNLARRDATNTSDQKLSRDLIPLISLYLPSVGRFIESRGGNPSVELYVTAKVKTVGDVVEVGKNFWLFWILSAPVPFL